MKLSASLFGTMFIASLVFGIPLRALAAEGNPNIILSEVNWAGSALSTADEWIELANLDAESVDISGWSLTGAAGSSANSIIIPEGTILAGYGTYLISNYDLTSGKTTLAVTPDLVTTAMSLTNSKLNIALVDATGTVVDAVVTENAPTTGSTEPFASMQRDLSTMAWVSANASRNLTDAMQFGDPGSLTYVVNPESEIGSQDDITTPVSETDQTTDAPQALEEGQTSTEVPEENPPTNDEALSTNLASEITDPVENEDAQALEIIDEAEDQTSSTPGSILIVAFMSAPTDGTAEWIMLYNTTSSAIDLTGWTVTDATGKATELSGIIASLGHITLENPKGKLNNDGDTIFLLDPSGTVIDQITYGTDELPEPDSGETLTRVGDAWIVIESTAEIADTDGSTETSVTADQAEIAEQATEESVETESPAAVEQMVLEEESLESMSTAVPAEIATETAEAETTSSEEIDTYSLDLPEQGSSLNPYSTGDVLITEFVSDPADGVEWIEIYNATDEEIDLTGWTITDAAGKVTDLSGILAASMYGTIENPEGKLNNDGDRISLYDPSGALIDTIAYGTEEIPEPDKGESVARAGDTWTITETPTPGEINFIPESTTYVESASSESTTGATTASSSSGTDAVRTTDHSDESQTVSDTNEIHAGSIASLSDASDVPTTTSVASTVEKKSSSSRTSTKSKTTKSTSSSEVTYTGVLTALPGTFGSQIAFIEGIELYFNRADWPTLQLGDVIQVRGIPSTAQGESRVKIASASAITVLRHEGERPQNASIRDLGSAKEGALMRITGMIIAREGKTLILEDASGQVEVIAYEKTGLSWGAYTGGVLNIIGVVRHINGKTYLYPRSASDITQEIRPLEESIAAGSVLNEESGEGGSFLPLAGALAATGGISAMVVWFLKRRNLPSPVLPLAENPS